MRSVDLFERRDFGITDVDVAGADAGVDRSVDAVAAAAAAAATAAIAFGSPTLAGATGCD